MFSISAWPYRRTDCRYIHELYSALEQVADTPVQISDYRPGRFWKPAPDVLHLHWPETALDHSFYPRALLRAMVVLADLALLRLRGTKVVWTRHDDGSHSQTHPRTERFFVSLYLRLTNGFIHLTAGSLAHFTAVGSQPQAVIPHGIGPLGIVSDSHRKAAKQSLGLKDEPVIAIIGRLQEYKNVVETIDAFAQFDGGQLLVAGNPSSPEYRSALEDRADVNGLTMILSRLEEEEFQDCLAASDVVVLLYSDHLNSGVAFEALATPSRIAVTDSASMRELVGQAGPEWVRIVSTPPTAKLLQEVLAWAGEPVGAESTLEDNWDQVGADNWAFLQSL